MRNYDRPTLILAVILALFLWAYVRVSQGSLAHRVIRSVPVSIVGQVSGLASMLHSDNNTVAVAFKGPPEWVNNVQRDDIKITVNVSDITRPGTTRHKVDVKLPQGIELDRGVPLVTVTTTALQQKTYPVTISLIASPPPGSTVGEYTVQPDMVTLEGTKEVLEQVKYVTAPVDPNNPMPGEVTLVPRVVDTAGKVVADARVLDASSVKVRMVSSTGPRGTREVAVRAPELQRPPKRYVVTVVKVRPDQVTLMGSTSLLERQPAYLETEPINVSNVTRDTTRNARLKIPRGITVVEGPDVRVDLQVQPID